MESEEEMEVKKRRLEKWMRGDGRRGENTKEVDGGIEGEMN